MTESRVLAPAPPRVDLERLQSPRYTVRATSPHGEVLVHYDPTEGVGAVLFVGNGTWSVYGPALHFADFVHSLRHRGIVSHDGEGLAEWVEACSQLQVPPTAGLN